MPKLTALRTITGVYGTAHEGQSFEVESEEDAESLEARGLAERYNAPRHAPNPDSFKMHFPVENKMRPPQPALANKRK